MSTSMSWIIEFMRSESSGSICNNSIFLHKNIAKTSTRCITINIVRREGLNLPARGVLAVFSEPATYPGFVDPPKPRTGSSSTWRYRSVDFESKKETPPSIEIVYSVAANPTGLIGPLDRSGHSQGYLSPPSPGREG